MVHPACVSRERHRLTIWLCWCMAITWMPWPRCLGTFPGMVWICTSAHRCVSCLRRRLCCVNSTGPGCSCSVPNRGRDLAPFLLDLLPAAQAVGHRSFIKLHTKSSPHLSDGETGAAICSVRCWIRLCCSAAAGSPAGPAGSCRHGRADHAATAEQRCASGPVAAPLWGARPGAAGSWFIASSMFAGGLASLRPFDLGLQRCDFEPENGQTDGTLAHSLERWIGVVGQRLRSCRVTQKPCQDLGSLVRSSAGMPESNHPASASLPDTLD